MSRLPTDAATTLLVSHLSPTTGMERCAVELAGALGEDVPVVAVGDDVVPPAEVVGRFFSLGRPLRGWRRLASVVRLRRWSAATRGVVVAVGVWTALPLLVCRRRLPFGVVVWEHSLSPQNVAATRSLRLLRPVAALVYRRADAVVAVSDVLADDVRRWLAGVPVVALPNVLPRQVVTSPHEPDDVPPPTGGKGDRVVVLTVGRLVPVKNHAALLRAMALLPDHWSLDVAGDGPLRDELAALRDELGLGDRVTFHGHVDDVGPLYEACTVVAQPSHGETFGLAMIEAARHDRDVVVLDFPLARQLVPVMVPGTVAGPGAAGMAEALSRSVGSPTPPEARRVAAERREEFLDPRRVVERWDDLLDQVRRRDGVRT